MADDVKMRIKVPKSASKGEIVEIKTLVTHPMESGQRKDPAGKVIPRRIINKFTCAYAGEPVFSADLYPSMSANPYIVFNVKVEKSGAFEFAWTDDDGTVYTDKKNLEVG